MRRAILLALGLALVAGAAGAEGDFIRYHGPGVTGMTSSGTVITSTVPVVLPDGTAAAPSLAFTSATTTGLFMGSGYIGFTFAGAAKVAVNNSKQFEVPSDGAFAFSTNSAPSGTPDLLLTRDAAASLQLGADAATATAQTIKAADSTGAGVAGASLTLKGGSGGTFGKQGNVVIDPSSTFVARHLAVSLTADAVIQFGQTVMPDASADGRFDVTTGNATLTIGVLGGVGASAQGTAYPVITEGLAYIAPAEDQAVTRGHYLLQSATAGYVNDSATVSTDGLNIGLSLYSEPVSNVIDPTGCGGGGCINTTTGAIQLSADVAAAGWTVGQPVIYWNSGGATPTGLTDGGVYFLKTVSTTTVTISATYGGAAVVPSDQGNDATQYLQRLPQAIISIR